MTVEDKKERNRKYGAICARAKAMGIGIQENIVRESFPATDFGYFVPRFAGRDA